jgi:hypothetical protein
MQFFAMVEAMNVNHVEKPSQKTRSPLYFRLPKPGEVDPYFGANRSFWNERILPTPRNNYDPPINSIVDRKTGAKTGCRFIEFQSALDYFTKLLIQQSGNHPSPHSNKKSNPTD